MYLQWVAVITLVLAVLVYYGLERVPVEVRLTVTIGKDTQDVFNFFTDPRRMLHTHPYIKEIEVLRGYMDSFPDGTRILYKDFSVTESIGFIGNLTWVSTMTAYQNPPLKIQTTATVIQNVCDVNVTWLFSSDGPAATRVEEVSIITVPRVLSGFTATTTREAHLNMFNKAKQLIEHP